MTVSVKVIGEMSDSKGKKSAKGDRRKRSLSELYGKDPDEALKRFLQTPKRKDEEDDEGEESESESDSEDEG